ncbi:MAG: class I SAM-dependent methyltransferase [Acidimicrobiales bacterium]
MSTADMMSATSVQARLDQLGWYHSIDVVEGAATKGWFDLRHALPLLPFPDLRGKRCLDIGTWDGFYAYEMERRGAAEVIALDVPDLAGIDYPPEVLAQEGIDLSHRATQPRSAGFELLHELLGSSVQWRGGSIYDLDPNEIGTFDFVVCGSLLVHLRDPVRALDAVRRVTSGSLLSIDHLHPPLQLLSRRRPLFQLRGMGVDFQWWLTNDVGAKHLLHVGGFAVDRTSDYFLLRHGADSPPQPGRSVRHRLTALGNRVLAHDSSASGHLHRGYLAHPRF